MDLERGQNPRLPSQFLTTKMLSFNERKLRMSGEKFFLVIEQHFINFAIGNLRNAVFCDGDRMSFLLPDDVVGVFDPPSGFRADVKIEVLPFSLERE